MRGARAMVVALALQSACYNYVGLHARGLAPSSYVAVTLTEAASDELARYLGPEALIVRGRYLGPLESGLSLSVESVESRRGIISRWAGETVVVPGEFVRQIEERHAAGSKTLLLAGAALGGLVVVFRAFGQAGSGGIASPGGLPSAH